MRLKRTSIIIPRLFHSNIPYPYGYIYITTNTVNNKQYIGQHVSVVYHPIYLGSGTTLQKAIKKYGKENFVSEPIDWAKSKEELDQKEIWWIEFLGATTNREHYYNISLGGNGGDLGEEVNKKISKALKGRPSIFKGHHHSEKSKQLLREHNLGKPSPFKGRHWSEEDKKFHSEIRKGRHFSPETEFTSENSSGKLNNSAKPIVQLSKTGEFIRYWDYMSQVHLELGFDVGGIRNCCQGKQQFCKGYKWMFKEDYEKLTQKTTS